VLRNLDGLSRTFRSTAATANERELHGEKFVKGEATEGGIALFKLTRPVSLR
jgi:hypothetical protein